MNKIILIGNLTKDPEGTETPSGTAISKFSLAVAREFKKDETDFFNITVFGTLAQNCTKFLKKGKKAAVVGRLENRTYEDRNGEKRYVTDIIASDVEFLSPKDADEVTLETKR